MAFFQAPPVPVGADPFAQQFGQLILCGRHPQLPQLTADLVLCSHSHGDHNAEDKVTLTGQQTDYTVETLCCFHDDVQGKKRGENLIRIVSGGGARVAHLGDVGHMLPPGQIKAIGHVDALLIPVGGFYTIDAKTARELADAIDAQLVIPMHYRMGQVGLPAVGEVEDFLSLVDDYVYYPGDTISINRGTRPQIAVLSFQG